MTQLKMLSADDKLAEIRRLYFSTSKQSIQQDFARALELLKSMATEDERERATVYMEGLAEMQKDWLKQSSPRPPGSGSPGKPGGSTPPGAATKGRVGSGARPTGKPGKAQPRSKKR